MNLSRWLRSTRIATQITVVVFVSGVIASAVITVVLLRSQPEGMPPPGPQGMMPPSVQRSAARVGTLLQALQDVPPSHRAELVASYRTGKLTIDLDPATSPSPAKPVYDHVLAPLFIRELPRDVKLKSIIDGPGNRVTLAAGLADGTPVLVHLELEASPPGPLRTPPAGPGPPPGTPPGAGPPPAPPPTTPPVLPPLVFLVAVSLALSVWVTLRLVAPLSRFVEAVEKFGLANQGGPLPEEGPAEIRRATGAFNRMRERILRLVEDRTEMMMAISHDLRTPLTRLRLRAEDVGDADLQRGMLRDIEMMERSIADAVSNLRHATTHEARERTDLPSLLVTICDEFADAGLSVEYEGPQRLDAHLRPQAISRAVTNLVQNATKFGSRVTVRLSVPEAGTAQIDVEDDGPGIPDAEKQAVLKPFYRSDPARQQAGGFGLGLAIAVEVARDHAGTLTLHDRMPHGLCARLRLPLNA
jgi:signal transduction histidine kinase